MNLIICYTPLQVLIAEKIIEQHSSESFFGLMISSAKNAKFDYYRQKLEGGCEQFFAMHQRTDRFGLFKDTACLKWHFLGKKFDKIFVASINDLQIQTVLSSIHFNTLFTFDDGTANITPTSCFYIEPPQTKLRKIVNTIWGNRYSLSDIKNLSQGHYTLYPSLPNIIENLIPIKLIENSSEEKRQKDVIHLLLGQPVFLEAERNIKLVQKVVQKFNISHYLPHPREQYQVSDVEYIHTALIFEDYLQRNPDKYYRVYTYFSSAVLNVMNLPNVEVIVLRIDTENPAFEACYLLFEQLNLTIVEMRNE
ncbi:MAG: glycosyltransferase family 52 [Lonepinella koalarum]|nr:glycosyltransferase family 52 [Lonepinella koalarum]